MASSEIQLILKPILTSSLTPLSPLVDDNYYLTIFCLMELLLKSKKT